MIGYRASRRADAARIAVLTHERDLAVGAVRAQRDTLAARIESVADAHALDAAHLDRLTTRPIEAGPLGAAGHRAVSDALRTVAADLDLVSDTKKAP